LFASIQNIDRVKIWALLVSDLHKSALFLMESHASCFCFGLNLASEFEWPLFHKLYYGNQSYVNAIWMCGIFMKLMNSVL